jgi:hypothetical protein
MRAVTGVFASSADAEHAARKLQSYGLQNERIVLLFPDHDGRRAGSVPLSAAEQPGMGRAVGGVVGAASGIAGGFELGGWATAFLPGVGPVVALGLVGAALLGLAGATLGAAAGKALETATTEGLPEDEIFVYEDALRKGRSVLIALPDDEAAAAPIRRLIESEGAESVDVARDRWWIGLRSAEQEHYSTQGRDFGRDEKYYRLGFEAALHARRRCKEYDQVLSEMQAALEDVKQRYPNDNVEEPFRRGYERGRDYYQSLCNKVGR